MTRQASPQRDRAGFLADIIREFRLVWRLLRDPRVPFMTKLIPLAAVLYIVFPLDVVSDLLVGLGQLDDLAILILGMELFISASPALVVDEIRRQLSFGRTWGEAQRDAQTVDTTARPAEDVPPARLEDGKSR